MAIHKLTPRQVAKIIREAKPGMNNDGGKLYLFVNRGGSITWVFRYRFAGRERNMGLGPVHTVGITKAREEARKCRELLLAVMRLNGLPGVMPKPSVLNEKAPSTACCGLPDESRTTIAPWGIDSRALRSSTLS
jgi:hypothetical protein